MLSALVRCLLVLCIFVTGFANSALAEGLQRITVFVGGLTRYYDLQVPTDTRNYPLVLMFHGGLSTPEHFAQVTGMADLAARQNFAVAFLAGTSAGGLFAQGLIWNAGGCCAKAMQSNVNDEAFVRAVIQQITSTHPVDTHRIYLAGFSNGAMLVNVLAERLAGQIAAAAVVGGPRFVPVAPGRPVSIVIIHALDDDKAPYAGGYSSNRIVQRAEGAPFLPVEQGVAGWVNRDLCRTKNSEANSGYTVIQYGNCAGSVAVTLIAIAQGGHQWYKNPIDASSTIWNFLSRFSS